MNFALPKALARDTAWVGLSQVMRICTQAAYFVIAARTLGVRGFGTFAASLAVVSILGTFAALGTGNLLVMNVSRRPQEFSMHWGNALVAIPSAGALLSCAAVVTAVLVPSLPLRVVSVLCASELVFNRVADTAGQAFQSLGRFIGASTMWGLVPVSRAAGAVLFLLGPRHDVLRWAFIYTSATAIAAVFAVGTVSIYLGRPAPRSWHGVADLRLGIYFSLSQAFSSIYADIDKTMLAQIASSQAAGIYTAAYRAISFVFVPTMALFQASYGRFFQHGERGVDETRRFARTLLPYVIGFNIVAGGLMFVAASLAPVVLGSGYSATAPALRWLAAVPLFQALTYVYGDVLTGVGEQGLRTSVQLGAAVLNILLNAVLDPRYSWRGAAWATLLTFAALAAGLRVAVAAVSRRTSEGTPYPVAG